MLVLTRKIGEMIRIGEEIELVVVDVSRGRVKLGFSGPRNIRVRRSELAENAGERALSGNVSNDSVPNEGSMRPVVAASPIPIPGRPLRSYRAALAEACSQG